jgi:membrane protease YdiL (CAAX protease family)
MSMLPFDSSNAAAQVGIFYIAACAITWPLWLYSALSPPDSPNRLTPVVLGGAGPMLAATLTTLWCSGSSDVATLYSSIITLPPQSSNLVRAMLLPLILVVCSVSVHWLVRPAERALSVKRDKSASVYPDVPGICLYVLLMLPLPMLIFEELGWRAFALPRLLLVFRHVGVAKYDVVASVVLGVMWAVWHWPLLLPGPDASKPAHALGVEHIRVLPQRLLVYSAALAVVSVAMTWVCGNADWSTADDSALASSVIALPMALVFHASFNSAFGIFRIERVGSVFASVLPTCLVLIGAFACVAPSIAFGSHAG